MQSSCYGGTNAFLLEPDFPKTPLCWSFCWCSKAAQGNTQQSSCCSTAHPGQGCGELLVQQECFPDIHSAPSLPCSHSRSCAGDRNDSYPDHSTHSPGLLTVPLPKGQLAALVLLLRFSPFPGEHSFFFLQLTWTKRCHELLLKGLQMEVAAERQHLCSVGRQSEYLTHCNIWQITTVIRHMTSLLVLMEHSQQNLSCSSDQCFKISPTFFIWF